MVEYVDRQAAIDALGERPMTWTDSDYELGCADQYDSDKLAIKAVPSADVVEVVQCKDCRYGHRYFDIIYDTTDSWVECRNPDGLNRDTSEDSFCSYGERKE